MLQYIPWGLTRPLCMLHTMERSIHIYACLFEESKDIKILSMDINRRLSLQLVSFPPVLSVSPLTQRY